MAADVIALLDHEKIEKAHLVGYSMGGLLTLQAITMAPDRFLSAVIGGQGWTGRGVGQDNGLAEQIASALESGRGIEPLMRALNPEGAPQPSREQMKTMNDLIMKGNDARALAAVIRSADGWLADRTEMLANPVPAMAVVGDRDPLIAAARNLAGNLANLQRLEIIIGATHAAVVRDATYAPEFGQLIARFVASVDESAQITTSD
jgi:pimeloyl-ACP methyl ester carboxylesterase